MFLLKGHEDLRQDERAMQLFGLVNALLFHDRRTGSDSHALSIQRYAVLPLSPTAGLISWVPNCDTLHDLIRDHRENRKILLNVEHKLMQQVAPNQLYETLPAIHKLEVFEYALANTAGEDLTKILWLKSETSEAWLQRRSTYTRSLAVMSMVGYVLGLGDRHPSNLMLDRNSGRVLHIDFGDCFEVAMQREKFPEKVPFRLTRMLVNAMEVSGIEGSYRLTCEKVMSVLRENRDSLVATLEAFVHDPLISWRLLHTADKTKGRKGPEGQGGSSATSSQKVPSTATAAVSASASIAATTTATTPTTPFKEGAETCAEGTQNTNHSFSPAVNGKPVRDDATASTTSSSSSGAAASGSALLFPDCFGGTSRVAPAGTRGRGSSSLPPLLEGRPGGGAETDTATTEVTAETEIDIEAEEIVSDFGKGDEGNLKEEMETEFAAMRTTKKSKDDIPPPIPPVADFVSTSGSGGLSSRGGSFGLDQQVKPSGKSGGGGGLTRAKSGSGTRVKGGLSLVDLASSPQPPLIVPYLAFANAAAAEGGGASAITEVSHGEDGWGVGIGASLPASSLPMPIASHLLHGAGMDEHEEGAEEAEGRGVQQQMEEIVTTTFTLTTVATTVAANPSAADNFEVQEQADQGLGLQEKKKEKVAAGQEINLAAAALVLSSSMNPNLHLDISSLAQQSSRTSFSMSRRSAMEISRAQAEGAEGGTDCQEELTEKAVIVIRRVMDKLTGLDFGDALALAHRRAQAASSSAAVTGAIDGAFAAAIGGRMKSQTQHLLALDVEEQVDLLIRQATANENLCLSYFGWCPFW